jgi:hypothetical protein
VSAAPVLVTPVWIAQMFERRERHERRWKSPLLPAEKEYRRIVGDIDARRRGIPSDRAIRVLVRVAQVPEKDHRFANALGGVGLRVKAQRRRLCNHVGRVGVCTNTQCGGKFFAPFGCNTRFCPRCGPRLSAKTFRQQFHRLRPIVDSLLRRRGYLLAKLDLTAKSLRRMPTPQEIHEFNNCIKRFRANLLTYLGLKTRDIGFARAFEFGQRNTNLHAHCIWLGPRLPSPKAKGRNERGVLSRMWEDACRGTAFEGSFIASVKRAESFERALGHCLKYGLKHIPADPARAAALELAFNGVRRFQCGGAFFNAPKVESECKPDSGCPTCQATLEFSTCSFFPRTVAVRWGFVDLGQARRARILSLQPTAARAP